MNHVTDRIQRVVPEFRGEDAPVLYDCHKCKDTGRIHFEHWRHGRTYEATWFCVCDKAHNMELSFWYDQVYRFNQHGKRELSDKGQRAMRYYQSSQWPQVNRIGNAFPDYAGQRRMGEK